MIHRVLIAFWRIKTYNESWAAFIYHQSCLTLNSGISPKSICVSVLLVNVCWIACRAGQEREDLRIQRKESKQSYLGNGSRKRRGEILRSWNIKESTSHHDYKSEYSVTDIASPDAEGECWIIHQMQSLPSDRQTVASPVITIRQEQEHQSSHLTDQLGPGKWEKNWV